MAADVVKLLRVHKAVTGPVDSQKQRVIHDTLRAQKLGVGIDDLNKCVGLVGTQAQLVYPVCIAHHRVRFVRVIGARWALILLARSAESKALTAVSACNSLAILWLHQPSIDPRSFQVIPLMDDGTVGDQNILERVRERWEGEGISVRAPDAPP